ncbi:MAG TPA: lipopolysaccharide biosynthesis protein [Verrucomicrobiota bacterium]|nr:lipopolysaccharide biosynthesis protein [Verrucomicrobiota bacterium]HQF60733.1 lipopolysaccharide biosynthesis protein [Verrucomicrobiota bacterium]HQK01821.1 lipopolysaccharide biosynthesis protein [Verrucomicrobiota bacterium]
MTEGANTARLSGGFHLGDLVSRIRAGMGLVRLQPFDTSTEVGRGKERLRRALLTSITAALARAVGMATPLITIALTLDYLGSEIYGLWMTVTSFVGMFVFADLGLGNGLVTALSRALGRGENETARRLVSTTVLLLGGLALVFGLLTAAVWPFLSWPTLLNARSETAAGAASGVVAVYAFSYLLYLPLGTLIRTQMAAQEGFQANLWQCAGSVLGVAVVFAGVRMQLSPAMFILVVSLAPQGVTIANWFCFFRFSRPDLKPRLSDFSHEHARMLLRTGLGFFLISIMTSISLHADNVIVAHICGLDAVTSYAVPARAMAIVGAVVNMICSPMWAANGEALARGDVAWVRRNTRRLVALSFGLTALVAALLVAVGPWAFRLWLGEQFQVTRSLLASLAGFGVCAAVTSPFFMVLNGGGVVFFQAKLFMAYTPLALVAEIALAGLLGPMGVALGKCCVYALIVLPAVIWMTRRVLRARQSRGDVTLSDRGF